MANEFISPNWHVAIIHFPLGLLITGVLIELFSFMWRRSAFRAAGRWMILLGALSGIPAATSGIYALSDVSRMGLDESESMSQWKDIVQISPLWKNEHAAHFMRDHVWLQSVSTALAVLVCVIWMGCSDKWRGKLHVPLMIVLLIATGLTISGAWHAGEAVYREGVAVSARQTTNPETAVGEGAGTQPAGAWNARAIERRAAYFLPPLQLHAVLAGFAVAIALGALGLSLRAISAGPGVPHVDHIAHALGPPELAESESESREELIRQRVPAARFWMLAFLVALLTALAGAWVLSRGYETWDPKVLWQAVSDRDQSDGKTLTRRLAHVGAGSAIIVLPLFLAIFARVAPRAKFILLLLALLLLAAIVAQVWLGVLLMFDTNVGPLTRFN